MSLEHIGRSWTFDKPFVILSEFATEESLESITEILRFSQDDGIKFTSLRDLALAGAWQFLLGCDTPKRILRFSQDDG